MKSWKKTSLLSSAAIVIAGFLIVQHVQSNHAERVDASHTLTEQQRMEADISIQSMKKSMFEEAETLIGKASDEQLEKILQDDFHEFITYLNKKTESEEYTERHPEVIEFLMRNQTFTPSVSI